MTALRPTGAGRAPHARRAVALGAACAALLATALAADPAAAKTRSCGFVAFAPNSDFGAFRIVAKNASCKTARRVARASRDLNVAEGPYRYTALGFTCRGTFDDSSLPSVNWVCKRRHARVTFSRS